MSLPVKTFAGTFQLTTSVVIEQQTKDNRTGSKTSPSKRFKTASYYHDTPVLNDNNQGVVTTSDSSKSLDVNISTLEITLNWQPSDLYDK